MAGGLTCYLPFHKPVVFLKHFVDVRFTDVPFAQHDLLEDFFRDFARVLFVKGPAKTNKGLKLPNAAVIGKARFFNLT